jgi:hypothetical protein
MIFEIFKIYVKLNKFISTFIQNKCHPQKYSLLAHCHQDMTLRDLELRRRIELKVEEVFSY